MTNENTPNGAASELSAGLGLPASPYQWNGSIWQFYVAAWGGWCALREDTKSNSRPMTYLEGVQHINRMYS